MAIKSNGEAGFSSTCSEPGQYLYGEEGMVVASEQGRKTGECSECGRTVGLVPGVHTMKGGPPDCAGSHYPATELYSQEDYDLAKFHAWQEGESAGFRAGIEASEAVAAKWQRGEERVPAKCIRDEIHALLPPDTATTTTEAGE